MRDTSLFVSVRSENTGIRFRVLFSDRFRLVIRHLGASKGKVPLDLEQNPKRKKDGHGLYGGSR